MYTLGMQTVDTIIENSAHVWGVSYDEAFGLLSLPRQRCVRLNSLKQRKNTINELVKDGVFLAPLAWTQSQMMIS